MDDDWYKRKVLDELEDIVRHQDKILVHQGAILAQLRDAFRELDIMAIIMAGLLFALLILGIVAILHFW